MAPTKVRVFLTLLPAFLVGVIYADSRRKFLQSLLSQSGTHVITFLCGLLLPRLIIALVSGAKGTRVKKNESSSIYGLDHGRLHLKIPPPMWMNMGYWHQVRRISHTTNNVVLTSRQDDYYDSDGKVCSKEPKLLAIACKDLLNEVLETAGFNFERESVEIQRGTRRSKCLIDLGFGCGEQTIYLVSRASIRPSDREWWDCQRSCVQWDYYVGATLDRKQFQHAAERMREFRECGPHRGAKFPKLPDVKLSCEDAANPEAWSEDLKANVVTAISNTRDHWVLALDTLYHFSPSRWPIIKHFARLETSFMTFDLCLSSQASFHERIILRILTNFMGAPWANFVTIEQYREKLIEAGYLEESITIRDISPHVFEPLAEFLEAQDRRLNVVGYGLGSFRVAQWMFAWWGRSGVVRGVIVVAKQ